MRIAIVGAGASGLTAYLYLVKHLPQPPAPSPPHEFVVYESHAIEERKRGTGTSEIPLVGSGLGITPNGMNVLFDLDETLHREVRTKGFPATKFAFRNGRGWFLGSSNTVHDYGIRLEPTTMISRADVLESLFERIPKGVVRVQTITKVSDSQEQKSVIEFADGSLESFDLVIGADGVRSKTRDAILGEEYRARYKGLYSVAGFFPMSLLPSQLESNEATASGAQVIMTFGGNGFFGYAPCTSAPSSLSEAQLRHKEPVKPGPTGIWWSSFERQDPDTRNVDMDEMREKLKKRHQDWADPSIRRIVENPDLDMMGVATWVMPKAPTWTGERIVLIGDAAHALPSTSGQGISQSMIDSQALALLLAHHLQQAYSSDQDITEEQALKLALKQYVEVRKPIVERILDIANRMGEQKKDMGFVQEMLMYMVFKIIFTFFGESFQKPVMQYDVRDEIRKILNKK